jgi:rod shape-determining protein MreC
MALLDGRPRSGYLFLAVMLGHILLISSQVNSRAGVPVLEGVTFGIFAEVQRGASTIVSGVRRVWGNYVSLRDINVENEELRRQLAATQIALQEQRALADRSRSLERLLDLRDRSNLKTVPAEVIAAGASPDFRTLTIDKGSREGVRRDMAVISASGVVGRIVVPSIRAAKVQMLIDRNAAAGALVERSRAQGVVVGVGDDRRLQMEYVSELADVVVGDTVVTSGIDGIFPKGFVIGRVDTIEKSAAGYKRILVRPSVDFSGLEEVLVVLTPTAGRELSEGNVE